MTFDKLACYLALGFGVLPGICLADVATTGSVSTGLRFHTEGPAFEGQDDAVAEFTADLDIRFDFFDDWQGRIGLLAYGRSDGGIIDAEFQEARLGYGPGSWRFEIGQGTFTNGQSLGTSVYDVVNTRSFTRDIADPDKLGQPFVGLGYSAGSWEFQALALYGHRQPRVANDTAARFRLVAPVNRSAAIYEEGANENDWGAAVSAIYRGSFADFELFYFDGPSRVAALTFDPTNGQFVPIFPRTRLAALGAQKAFDTWLLGVEIGMEEVSGETDTIFSLSAERQFFIGDTELTLNGQLARQRGVLVRGVGEDARTAATLSGSFAFNSIFPSSLDLTVSVDTDTGSVAATSVSYNRNLSDELEFSVSYTAFGDGFLAPEFDGISSLASDDFVRFEINRSF